MPFSYKVHRSGSDTILAVADSDVVGRKFSDREKEIEISNEFYNEQKADAGTIARLAKEATIINAIGKKAVELLIDKGLVKGEETVEVCGLPHAQVFVIR
jgi:hypothetical protein